MVARRRVTVLVAVGGDGETPWTESPGDIAERSTKGSIVAEASTWRDAALWAMPRSR
jgi:hypothetical protein